MRKANQSVVYWLMTSSMPWCQRRVLVWRKERARARGVESDVILPRTALWDLARRTPRTHDELAAIADFGPWRRATYGDEILALMGAPRGASGSGNLFSDER